MSEKATRKKLNKLHAKVTDYYIDFLDEASEDELEIASGTLSAINAFLKQNDVSADISDSEKLASLKGSFQDRVKAAKKKVS